MDCLLYSSGSASYRGEWVNYNTTSFKQGFGTWNVANYSSINIPGVGTRTNVKTVTYTPNSRTYSYYNPDFIKFVLVRNNGSGINGIALELIVYTRIIGGGSGLHSRFSALNSRTMFTINVKDIADANPTSLVQLYASSDGKIHDDLNENVDDVRFNQTFIFGPYVTAPCSIEIKNLTSSTFSSFILANGFSAYSDYRIKSNIETLNNTHTVDNIRVIKYTTCDNSPHFGVIAHELSEVYPELVTGKKDEEKLQSVSYIELIPILINEIQTIKKELVIMKKDNKQLLSKIEYLEHGGNA